MLYFDLQSLVEQQFKFPAKIINSLIQNPENADFWESMIKTCKYIYQSNPLIPTGENTIYDDADDGGIIAFKDSNKSQEQFHVKFINAGIWLRGQLDVYGGLVNLMNIVAQSEITEITIHSGAVVFAEDVLAIGYNVSRLNYENITVLNDDETVMSDARFTKKLMKLEKCQMVISYRTNNNNYY